MFPWSGYSTVLLCRLAGLNEVSSTSSKFRVVPFLAPPKRKGKECNGRRKWGVGKVEKVREMGRNKKVGLEWVRRER